MHFKWGIIGTSIIAYEVSYAINFIKGNEIVAVLSKNIKNAKRFAKKMGLSKSYDNLNEFLEDREIDIVYIAAPSHMHFDFIKMCFEKGKHVLCEKPICLNAQDARNVKTLARQKKLFCMEANWVLFNPAIQKLISYVNTGKIGDIMNITGSFGHKLIKSKNDGATQETLLDLGVYLISICVILLGKPGKVMGYDAYDHEHLTFSLIYNKNTTVSFTCSHIADLKNDFIIVGNKGIMTINDPFYRSGVVGIEKIQNTSYTSSEEKQLDLKIRNYYQYPLFLKYGPFLKRIYKKIMKRNLLTPFIGNSYHYQIEEVNKCLAKGLVESSIHPLENSVATLEIIELIKKNN